MTAEGKNPFITVNLIDLSINWFIEKSSCAEKIIVALVTIYVTNLVTIASRKQIFVWDSQNILPIMITADNKEFSRLAGNYDW